MPSSTASRTVWSGSSSGSCGRKPTSQARHRHRLAFELLVLAGHDAQQARLAGAVQAQHADLRAGKERQRDVLEDDAWAERSCPRGSSCKRIEPWRSRRSDVERRNYRKVRIPATGLHKNEAAACRPLRHRPSAWERLTSLARAPGLLALAAGAGARVRPRRGRPLRRPARDQLAPALLVGVVAR